jgi:5-methylcytosine-specific restriction endonuclease McrA
MSKIDWKKLRTSGDYMSVLVEFWNFYPKECLKCGYRKRLQIDHIRPISKFPHLALDINNMQPLCKKCNFEKSNKEIVDYRTDEDILDIKDLYELKTWLHIMRKRWRKYLYKTKNK